MLHQTRRFRPLGVRLLLREATDMALKRLRVWLCPSLRAWGAYVPVKLRVIEERCQDGKTNAPD